MTLPERLAREALRLIRADLVLCDGESGRCRADLERSETGDWVAHDEAIPAVEDAIREAIEACAATRCYPCDHFGAPTLLPGRRGLWHCTPSGEPVAHCDAYSIRRLLTDEETP